MVSTEWNHWSKKINEQGDQRSYCWTRDSLRDPTEKSSSSDLEGWGIAELNRSDVQTFWRILFAALKPWDVIQGQLWEDGILYWESAERARIAHQE